MTRRERALEAEALREWAASFQALLAELAPDTP